MATVLTARFTAYTAESGSAHARPLVLVHGSGLTGATWTRTRLALGERRFIVPDLIGYGRSSPAPRGEDVTAEDDLEILERVTAEVGDAIDVVAHSYGGVLAARLALRVPSRIARLVLIEPVFFAQLRAEPVSEAVGAELARLYDDPEFLDESFGGTEPWMKRFFDYWWGEGAWAALPQSHRRASMRSAWKVFREVKSISASVERFADLGGIAAELTLVRGTKTTACARAIVDRLATTLPSAALREIEGAGHLSPLTHPLELASVLRDRLR